MEYQPNLKNITGSGGTIVAVEPQSTAAALGLRPGDQLLSVNGHVLRDIIDYQFAIAKESVDLVIRRDGNELQLRIDKDPADMLGIEFSEPLFDRLRTCNNKCPFCFLTQMPKGMRRTLYLKDDDYRLSFLYGNFVTLTNLKEDDWRRIEEQKLGPMYVSVHATDRALRAILLGKPDVPDVLEQIRRLGDLGIDVHTQVVCCPGVNDGPALAQTVEDLAALYPIVQTISAVPVGLTKYRFNGKAPQTIRAAIQVHERPEWIDTNWERQPLWEEALRRQVTDRRLTEEQARALLEEKYGDAGGFCSRLGVATEVPLRTYRPEEAAAVIDLLEPYQQRYWHEYETYLVYPSDEFYLLCGRETPPAYVYEGYQQHENGVGMVRKFLDEWEEIERRLPARLSEARRMLIVCGTLAAPVLQRIVDRLNRIEGLRVVLRPVVNEFFGDMVTVSGLLTGQDVVAALGYQQDTDLVVLPRVMFDYRGERTIDEYTPEQIGAEIGAPLALAATPYELLQLVRQPAYNKVAA
ncbi:MAG: hypothetical protein KatS3mg057_1260 [Herpetosiphonaceae bacterium]|nr:MAG: hypothetical protein KatS3mg057_1260 [Herpetosiphonaceae bacterium]